jgi:serine/threonine-protein kinase
VNRATRAPAASPTLAPEIAESLAWIDASGAALASLAFGRAGGAATPDLTELRHLALLPSDSLELDLDDPAERQFGDYELVELLGRGGMGVVYRARQASLEREVAIKLLAAGPWASREFIERFQREARNVARMQHPNIVAIHEIGEAEGLHFFSMQLVRGQSLAAAIAEAGPFEVHRAARLMRTVAEALAYAHSLGVLHHDLKPANVLLDGDGVPHVADFGLARRLDGALALDNAEVSGTPAYMAPERAEARAQAITSATDVFGLGAILYELVTGEPPFRAESAQETLKLVAEGKVRRPRWQAPHHPADIEAIILTCLAKDPAARYASARALADDLGRFGEGRPVQARPLNAVQKVARWTRREPRLAIASMLVVAALVGGLVATTREWRRAEGNAARAEAVRGFLARVFEHASPDENKGQPFTAHQLLELGEKQLDRASAEPAIAADVTTLLGRLYIGVSDFRRSEALLRRAEAMLADPRVTDDVRARVHLGMALIDNESGNYEDALSHARTSLALLESAPHPIAEEIASAHVVVASALVKTGAADAEPLLLANLARDEALLGAGNPSVADQRVQLGNLLARHGRFDESEAAFSRAIAGFTAAYGATSNSVAHALNEMSNMLEDKGDLAGAEKALDEALRSRMATVGPDHHDTSAVESNLLWLMEYEGRYAEALPKRIEIIDRATRAGQLHEQDRATVLASLGKDYRELGRFDEAVATLREAVGTADRLEGANSMVAVPLRRQLGLAQMLAGDYAGADVALTSALDVARAHDPPTAPTLNLLRADLGKLRRWQHRLAESLVELNAANEVLAKNARPTDMSRPLAQAELAQAELDAGDVESAGRTADEALAAARKAYPARHYMLGVPLFAVASTRLAAGRAGEAEPLLVEALAVRSPPHPASDPRVLEVEVALVDAWTKLGKSDEARRMRDEVEPRLRALGTPYGADLRQRLADATRAR